MLLLRNYFNENSEIQRLTQKLWDSINWQSCRFDEDYYYLTQEMDGTPELKRLFNEYLLLIMCLILKAKKPIDMNRSGNTTYKGHDVITDHPGHFLPLFTFPVPTLFEPI